LPLDRVIQIHIAGHEQERPGLLIDTHGSALIDPVIDLYRYTCKKLREPNIDPPTLLERDNNIHEVSSLYRRFVRGGCARAIKRAIPVTMAVMGESKVDELLAQFFEKAPPKTKLYRSLPMDFSAHIQTREDLELALRELIHFEILELEVLYAENADDDHYTKVYDTTIFGRLPLSRKVCLAAHRTRGGRAHRTLCTNADSRGHRCPMQRRPKVARLLRVTAKQPSIAGGDSWFLRSQRVRQREKKCY